MRKMCYFDKIVVEYFVNHSKTMRINNAIIVDVLVLLPILHIIV